MTDRRPADEPAPVGQHALPQVPAAIPMSETKTVGSLTERQRHALAALLERHATSDARRRAASPVRALAAAAG